MLPAFLVIIGIGGVIGIALFERLRRRYLRAADRWAISSRIGVVAAEGFEEADTAGNILRLVVPGAADWCVLHLLEDGQMRRAAVVHKDLAMERRLRETFTDRPFITNAAAGPQRVIETGKSYLIREFGPGQLEKQPDFEALSAAGLGSCISVPLKARRATVGVLSLARAATHAYDDDDLVWAQDLAHRIGLSIENRHLYAQARELFEQTVSANFVSTPEGRILACNQTFASLFGFDSIDDALATPAVAYYPDAESRQRFIAALREQKRVAGFESTLRRRDGQPVAVSINAVGTFNDRDELFKITGLITDRTAQRTLEDQLRQAQRLEAVGHLAGGIAHDFNNLLTVIIGCTDLLRADRPPPVVLDEHDPLDELAKAAERAAALTHQLLAFSRRQVLQPRVMNLNDALGEAPAMLRQLMRDTVALVLELDPKVSDVKVDPSQLDQVIINLVVNSCDAMPSGGTLTLSTGDVVVGERQLHHHPDMRPGAYVSLTVRDTGVGMDEATRAHAFEPFFTTKPRGKGTGLGLSTVYGIVKQSGGYIWVTSAPGQGTAVQVFFPPVARRAPGA